eukprot:CAMPEP_0171280022 /NCGR_PEP_ID=MMETSP0790-20130122/65682_1 /TAXON_ID=2925 /ORGANISM="Alexandrium catenella, Strain OF101" /LENGTH=217 /DNA_ID=CAMNT_0011749221 /DNA_START=20 /DNA_END=670 /DNA_ORIENTATION=+
MNAYFMRSDLIATASGMCNGYLYGYLAREDRELEPQFMAATEDCERSVRYFVADGIVLRYKMYTAKTKCFKNLGGIQDSYEGTLAERNEKRKAEEREGHRFIQEAFPRYYKLGVAKRLVQSMEGSFVRMTCWNARFEHGLRPDLEPRRRGEGRPSIRRAARASLTLRPPPSSREGGLAKPSPSASSSAIGSTDEDIIIVNAKPRATPAGDGWACGTC